MESSIEKNEVQKEQCSINAASVGSDARSHTKKGSRHRNTEKRRLQNREAQRTYRDKQKKRLQELEKQLCAHKSSRDATESSSIPTVVSSVNENFSINPETLDERSAHPNIDVTNLALENWVVEDFLQNTYTEDSHQPHAAAPVSVTHESHEVLRGLENTPISSAASPALLDTQAFLLFNEFTLDSAQRPDRSFQAPFSQTSSISTGISPATTGFLYANHIRLQDVTFLAATLANAASIGVSRDDYLQDKPSPFLIAAQREPRSHMSRNFEHIKPHL